MTSKSQERNRFATSKDTGDGLWFSGAGRFWCASVEAENWRKEFFLDKKQVLLIPHKFDGYSRPIITFQKV